MNSLSSMRVSNRIIPPSETCIRPIVTYYSRLVSISYYIIMSRYVSKPLYILHLHVHVVVLPYRDVALQPGVVPDLGPRVTLFVLSQLSV